MNENLENLKQEIIELIRKNLAEDSITLLNENILKSSRHVETLILIEGDYNSFKQNSLSGQLSKDEIIQRNNVFNANILALTNSLENEDLKTDEVEDSPAGTKKVLEKPTTTSPELNWKMGLIMLGLLISSFFIGMYSTPKEVQGNGEEDKSILTEQINTLENENENLKKDTAKLNDTISQLRIDLIAPNKRNTPTKGKESKKIYNKC